MSKLSVSMFIKGKGGPIYTSDFIEDEDLRLSSDLDAGPEGGIEISDESGNVYIYDSLDHIAVAFLEKAPKVLEAGRAFTYAFKLSEGEAKITLSGEGMAVVEDENGTELEVPVQELIEALNTEAELYKELTDLVESDQDN